ncbi:hypothetical protein V1478_011287 [Vespula squamosa]|uniref:Uncharacterized protein n=1 Tax=Vespula squamosa TaxID=30214 RepID=A0ABD2AE31_VESSQ
MRGDFPKLVLATWGRTLEVQRDAFSYDDPLQNFVTLRDIEHDDDDDDDDDDDNGNDDDDDDDDDDDNR